MPQRIRIKLESFDHRVLDESSKKIVEAAKKSGADVSGPVPLPVKKRIFTVLTSPVIDKNAREQFEIRTHKRLIDIYDPTQEVINSLTELKIPAGVSVEIKH
ncbi:MAG: 30S ribosomal protein S10 [bacterium]